MNKQLLIIDYIRIKNVIYITRVKLEIGFLAFFFVWNFETKRVDDEYSDEIMNILNLFQNLEKLKIRGNIIKILEKDNIKELKE